MPGRIVPTVEAPSRLVLLLLRWLLFRLMFLSGLVKLASGDPTWRSFAAMRFHYQTQPLPTWTSWYIHLAPNWFQTMSVGGVFFTELIVPLFIFANRRLRLLACAMIVSLQLLIAVTGNYGFFNLLTIVLCVTLLDDAVLKRLRILRSANPHVIVAKPWRHWMNVALVAGLVPLTLVAGLRQFRSTKWVPQPLVDAWITIQPFYLANGYGLFAVMTTRRPELIVEGSTDGATWKAYEFKWKPGDVERRPRFCSPHMPRLDWQMWFAALDLYYNDRADPWLIDFLDRLREASPPALDLLQTDPFAGQPPRHLRVRIYDYRFTTAAERAASGAWWHRDPIAILSDLPAPP